MLVISTFFCARRASLRIVQIWRAPVIPSGWPRAMAPPFGLRILASAPDNVVYQFRIKADALRQRSKQLRRQIDGMDA